MESLSSRKWPLQSLYYCKTGTFFLAPQKGIFSLLKKWGGTCPHCPPVQRPLINAKSGNIRPLTDFISALNMVQQIKLFKINVEVCRPTIATSNRVSIQ
jgi:hypothetical protein